jgi:hypothetical protein
MVEKISQWGHETRTYLCACHLGFIQQSYKHMQEINNATIQSRSFAEKYLHIAKKKHSKP